MSATPAPALSAPVRGLVEALRRIGLERCQLGPAGGWCNEMGAAAGWCEHQEARAATAAWDRRPRLRDDAELRAKVASWLMVDDQCDDMLDDVCDLFEEHLFGAIAREVG